MKTIILGLLALAAGIGGSWALAATGPDGSATLEPLSSPSAQPSSVPSFVNGASISAGTSDTKASLSFTGYLPGTFAGGYVYYNLGGDAPVSMKGSTDEVDIGTVSGLTAGASASASVSALWWPHQSDSDLKSINAKCNSDLPKLIPSFTLDDVRWITNTDVDCTGALFTKETLQKLVDSLNTTISQCRDLAVKKEGIDRDIAEAAEVAKTDKARGATLKPKAPTTTEDLTDQQRQSQCDALRTHHGMTVTTGGKEVWDPKAKVVLKDDPATLKGALAEINATQLTTTPATLLTLGTKVNRQKDAYFNPSDLTTLIRDHTTGYGVNLALSQIRGNALYSGGFSYEKSYMSVDPTQYCSPVKGSTSTKCLSGTLGPPPPTFSKIVFTEARVLIQAGVFALAPRLEYDFQTSKFAAKLPLYFAPDKTKTLTGGVALGYVTHGQGFGVSVFVNKAFSFF